MVYEKTKKTILALDGFFWYKKYVAAQKIIEIKDGF